MTVFRRDRGISSLPHSHEFHDIVFVLRGRAVHVVDGYAHEFGAGDVLLVRRGQVHHYREVMGLRMLHILILPQFSMEVADAFHGTPDIEEVLFPEEQEGYRGHLSPGSREFGEALALVQAMESSLLRPHLECSVRFIGQWRSLLALIAHWQVKERLHGPVSRRIPQFETAEYRLRPAVRHLEEHFTDSVRLEDLADLAATSPRSLLRGFQTVTGRPPFVYLHGVRLHHAMLELRNTSRSVTAVAGDVGFNDLSYFNRKFKSFTGLSPTVWRQKRPHEW